MRLESPAIEDGQPIPKKYTEDGNNVSPPLQWTDVPEGTAEFALIAEDPDAPRDEPWVHWVMYHIPGAARDLPEDIPRETQLAQPDGAAQGVNTFNQNNIGYRGPAPPKGHGKHRYFFKLFALDKPINLADSKDKKTLLDAIDGHVLQEAELMGTYERA